MDNIPIIGSYIIIQPTESYFWASIRGYPLLAQGVFFQKSGQPLLQASLYAYETDFETTKRLPKGFLERLSTVESFEIFNQERSFGNLVNESIIQFSTLTEPGIRMIYDQIRLLKKK